MKSLRATLAAVIQRYKKAWKPKRRHVVHASKSRLTLNETETTFARYMIVSNNIMYAAEVAGVSLRVARLWLKKDKIKSAIANYKWMEPTGSLTKDEAAYVPGAHFPFSGDLKEAVGMRILPADSIFEAETDPRDGA